MYSRRFTVRWRFTVDAEARQEHRREGEAVPVKPPVAWRNPTARWSEVEIAKTKHPAFIRFHSKLVGFRSKLVDLV